jgi:5-methylcytosine-specific restriction enzyme A
VQITTAQIEAAYSVAVKVDDGAITIEAGATQLRDQHGLNINSARDFIGNYRLMLRGQVFKRSLSAAALDYFPCGIARDRGPDATARAVSATWKHIAYYEGIEDTRSAKLRSVLEKFETSLSGPLPISIHESHFEAEVAQSLRDSATARRARLQKASKTPAVIVSTTRVYVRNPDVVAEVLDRSRG